MPSNESVLGFSNRWYSIGTQLGALYALDSDLSIRLITAPYFIATKLEAFDNRGDNDFQFSHDIEDIVAIIDGRPELLNEIEHASDDVQKFLAQRLSNLLSNQDFSEALPGHMRGDSVSQERIPLLIDRIKKIAHYQSGS
jgi:predicted nucleotidyltransferase